MRLLIINQNASNKGDRAVLLFMLRELVRNGIRELTVSTNFPSLWKGFRNLEGARVRFISR